MRTFVELVFNENWLMPENHYNSMNAASRMVFRNKPPNRQVNNDDSDENMDEPNPAGNYTPSSPPSNNPALLEPTEENEVSFPDLGSPLPNVSVREQMRITSANRKKILTNHQAHKQRLHEVWRESASEAAPKRATEVAPERS
ncbi:hypothetical protein KR018_002741 [Drosophila ironensis]|nr:hypothetical protein KR018_002741 [Drosophila ironensis]